MPHPIVIDGINHSHTAQIASFACGRVRGWLVQVSLMHLTGSARLLKYECKEREANLPHGPNWPYPAPPVQLYSPGPNWPRTAPRTRPAVQSRPKLAPHGTTHPSSCTVPVQTGPARHHAPVQLYSPGPNWPRTAPRTRPAVQSRPKLAPHGTTHPSSCTVPVQTGPARHHAPVQLYSPGPNWPRTAPRTRPAVQSRSKLAPHGTTHPSSSSLVCHFVWTRPENDYF